jgi:hypothetical protein
MLWTRFANRERWPASSGVGFRMGSARSCLARRIDAQSYVPSLDRGHLCRQMNLPVVGALRTNVVLVAISGAGAEFA